MKWILFLLALLVVGVPGFAQKVNPQGKKLVKCITTDYQAMPTMNGRYQFSYDDKGNLTQIQFFNGTSILTFKKEGKSISFSHSSNYYINHIFDLTLNEKGYLATFKDIRTQDNKNYGYTQYDYKYNYDYEIGGDAIVDLANSEWTQNEGEQPKLYSSGFYHRLYSYFDGELQYGRFSEVNGELTNITGNGDVVHYTDLIDDTSVNLIWFLVQSEMTSMYQIPLLTEWCPTTAIKLPNELYLRLRSDSPIRFYEYVYENDNLTTMVVYRYDIYHSPTIMSCFNIEYYY